MAAKKYVNDDAAAGAWKIWHGGTPSGLTGDRWGVPEMWWYGKAKIFYTGVNIRYRAEDATSFWVEGMAEPGASERMFGVELIWNSPLPAGYIYKFVLTMLNDDQLPDYITVNDCIVWTARDGHKQFKEVHAMYVPAADMETVVIRLIKRLASGREGLQPAWCRLSPPHQGRWMTNNLSSQRGEYAGIRPAYEKLALPSSVQYISIEPSISNCYHHNEFAKPIRYDRKPLAKLPYETAQVEFVERQLSPEEGAKYFRLAGIETNIFQPHGEPFESWAEKSVKAGTKNLALPPVIELRHSTRPSAAPGWYQFFHLHSLLAGDKAKFSPDGGPLTVEQLEKAYAQAIEDTSKLARRWLELVPDGAVYLFEPEVNGAFGHYLGGISDSKLANWPGYTAVKNGGTAAWRLMFDFLNQFRRDFEAQMGDSAAKVKFMANFDRAGTQGAYAYKGGADIILHKNIHRQSLNVVVANSRGAGMAYGKEYGFDMDTWDRNYYYGYHPDEAAHGLLVYFHAGGRYIMDETPVRVKANGLLSSWGGRWLDFARYVHVHPKLGEQQVSIAVLRGFGDEWNRVAGPSASWEANQWLPSAEINMALSKQSTAPKWALAKLARDEGREIQCEDTYLGDYNLLELMFSQYGNARRTNPNRLATGTPYGPVNFIPWDTPVELLTGYRVVVYMGCGVGAEAVTAESLAAYVLGGGALMMAAGQLRGEDGRFIADEFLGVRLGEMKSIDELPYTELAPPSGGWTVMGLMPDGAPAAVRVQAGQGTLILLAGEYLTSNGRELPESILDGELEQASWLSFQPACDWLEYMVQKKASVWVLPLFHHGRGLFPSGNGTDHGAWTGTIELSLDRLGMSGQEAAVYKAVYDPSFDPEASLPMKLEPIAFHETDNKLMISLTVERFEELVIGPKATAATDYWGV
jgi:hypothetical protein